MDLMYAHEHSARLCNLTKGSCYVPNTAPPPIDTPLCHTWAIKSALIWTQSYLWLLSKPRCTLHVCQIGQDKDGRWRRKSLHAYAMLGKKVFSSDAASSPYAKFPNQNMACKLAGKRPLFQSLCCCHTFLSALISRVGAWRPAHLLKVSR